MSIEMKKVWFDGKKMVTQNIPESDIYKRHWDIASCKAYAEQLRDKTRANTAEHAAEAIEYLLTLTQPEQKPVAWWNDTGTHIDLNVSGRGTPLYTAPPQRTWVGLTHEEIDQGLIRSNHALQTAGAWRDGVEWAQSQLKDKNT